MKNARAKQPALAEDPAALRLPYQYEFDLGPPDIVEEPGKCAQPAGSGADSGAEVVASEAGAQPADTDKADQAKTRRSERRARKATRKRKSEELAADIIAELDRRSAATKSRRAKARPHPLRARDALEVHGKMMDRAEDLIRDVFDSAEAASDDMDRAVLTRIGLDCTYSYGRNATLKARLEDLLAKRD